MKPLSKIEIGKCCRVVGIEGQPDLCQRLMEMGICEGDKVSVVRKAPLGDPTEYHFGCNRISLRQVEASAILVEPT
ncbi:ferrous iron transport protein A [Telmatocola sphagniphila]|uniref:Ferrous iron transport protein A n=1 Tax=Telmatocola sphagniphila TaxID=1123043 RepID=A0A8E6EYU7_9BACT|nr:FeoA family protein [Telmatocola sphagniphila]QVL33053.1 ferrous iron transport protein A [Telmatocola sphagniphila]